MNKSRLEGLSDAVFAIVMTLLVIEIHVPELASSASAGELWSGLTHLAPDIASYVVSFTILSMYWTSHHAIFHFYLKTINRTLAQLNTFYLMLIALIPFSAHLLGTYPHNLTAIGIYALHVITIGITALSIFAYALRTHEVELHDVTSRMIKQARIRISLTPLFGFLGFCAALAGFNWLPHMFFVLPVIFNLLPGSLDATERLLGITIK